MMMHLMGCRPDSSIVCSFPKLSSALSGCIPISRLTPLAIARGRWRCGRGDSTKGSSAMAMRLACSRIWRKPSILEDHVHEVRVSARICLVVFEVAYEYPLQRATQCHPGPPGAQHECYVGLQQSAWSHRRRGWQ